MSTKPTGGPAFPSPAVSQNNTTGETTIHQSEPGITVRDYFAAKALPELIRGIPDNYDLSDEDGVDTHSQEIARVAYWIADAMIAERDK